MTISEASSLLIDAAAKDLEVQESELSVEYQLIQKAPTAQPGNPISAGKTTKVDPTQRYQSFPSFHYDSIFGEHVEFRLVRTQQMGKNKTPVKSTVYSFQYHPMPSCCAFGINRWVRDHGFGLSKKVLRAGLELRKAVGRHAGVNTLFITTGPSFSGGGEVLDDFETLYESRCGENTIHATPTRPTGV